MATSPVLVFTANSNTGCAALKFLAEQKKGVPVRGVVRKKTSMAAMKKDFPSDSITFVNADMRQQALLGAVFADDINAAFWSTPNTKDRVELTKMFLEACIANGVDFPIVISCLDADKGSTAFQKQFKEIEAICEKLKGTPVKKQALDRGKQVLQPNILRCANFYQNFFGSLGGISEGTLYYPLGQADGKLPHVDLQDVGKVIATILADPEKHGGKTYNLIGEYQSGSFIATAISMGTQHAVNYEEVDDETTMMAFEELGLPTWLAEGNVETLRYFREGGGQDISSDIEAITGQKPTTFRAFSKRELKELL